MGIRIVINGKEVESPLARFLIGLLAFVVLTLFSVVFILFFLPLIGVTLVLSFGIFIVIALVSLIALLFALAAYQYHNRKQERLEKL